MILECRSRQYIEDRVRAGVLEQGTVDLMIETGVGERLRREGLRHDGVWFSFGGRRHRINLSELTGGRAITVYAQQEVVKDLVQARLGAGGQIVFEVDDLSVHDLDSTLPKIRYRKDGVEHEVACDFIAGCDGFHGDLPAFCPRRASSRFTSAFIPSRGSAFWRKRRPRPKSWSTPITERGFALFSMRSPQITRLYLQCTPDEDLAQWPDDRVWEELCARMRTDDGWAPAVGPVIQKGVTGMRSFVIEPMQFGRLFLAGDAAHIVPAHWREGAESGDLGRARAFASSGRLLQIGPAGSSRSVFREVSPPHLESAALLLVDDVHAASFPGARRLRPSPAVGRTGLHHQFPRRDDVAGGELRRAAAGLEWSSTGVRAYNANEAVMSYRLHSKCATLFCVSVAMLAAADKKLPIDETSNDAARHLGFGAAR